MNPQLGGLNPLQICGKRIRASLGMKRLIALLPERSAAQVEQKPVSAKFSLQDDYHYGGERKSTVRFTFGARDLVG